MNYIKLMTFVTFLSMLVAFVSFFWQAFLSMRIMNKTTTLLDALLLIEASFGQFELAMRRIAVGFGACTDLMLPGPIFLNYSDMIPRQFMNETLFIPHGIQNKQQLLLSFGYYFRSGAAAERIVINGSFFDELIETAKNDFRQNISWSVGGNAPLMGLRFFEEGADVLLGADMSKRMRLYMPHQMHIIGEYMEKDDVHLILEYKAGDRWGPYVAPRANRLILHNDEKNPLLDVVVNFFSAVTEFSPHLLVISGLQIMDNHKFPLEIRETRLLRVHRQLVLLPYETLTHFEMASFVNVELVKQLQQLVLPYMNSLGMNEQELDNLRHVFQYGRVAHVTDWNPRVARTLDQMRTVFQILNEEYFESLIHSRAMRRRLLSRIHVHTLAYQVILTVRRSKWKNNKVAAAKAALMANRYVCQTEKIDLKLSSLLLDESFATTLRVPEKLANRVHIDLREGVNCWSEIIEVDHPMANINGTALMKIDVEFCVVPALVCRNAKKTAGAGDNISAAALAIQI